MKVKGKMIRQARIEKGLTQGELAKGICKQPTISHIEIKNVVESLRVVTAICERLDLDVKQIVESSNSIEINDWLLHVKEMCERGEYNEALELLVAKITLAKVDNTLLSKALCYFGLCHLYGSKNHDRALYYLYKVIELNESEKYVALAKNGAGVVYQEKEDYEIARDYFEESLGIVTEKGYSEDGETIQVYLSATKFFNSRNEYQRAYAVAEAGISKCQGLRDTYLADNLTFEQAHSAENIGSSNYKRLYNRALALAEFNQNKELIDLLKPIALS